jgi:hypothetical protein
MNARPERRYLYIEIEPEDWRTAIMTVAITWSLPMPAIKRVWWEYLPCAMCKRRYEYEMQKWKNGEYVWRRGMCLRHYFVRHLEEIVPREPEHLLDNRPISIVANNAVIRFNIETVNYKYDVKVTREVADMTVEYKGRTYRFAFRNHPNAYPLISSYAYILSLAIKTMHAFRRFLSNVDRYRSYANIVINGTTI